MPNAQLWIHNHTQDKKSISIVLDIAFMNNTYKNTDVLQRPVLLAFRISCISKQSETDWVEKDSERFYFYSREKVGNLGLQAGKEVNGDKFEYEEMAIESKRKMQGTILSSNEPGPIYIIKWAVLRGVSLIGVIPLHWVCVDFPIATGDYHPITLKEKERVKISVKWQSSDSERKGMWKKQLSFFIILFRFVNKSLKGPDLSLLLVTLAVINRVERINQFLHVWSFVWIQSAKPTLLTILCALANWARLLTDWINRISKLSSYDFRLISLLIELAKRIDLNRTLHY
ncbi:hypothetical protein ACJX0J_001843 (mitochondrion) [Zea mays]